MIKVREGYKNSELGVIPVEWEVMKLDSLGKIITGSTPKTSNQDFYLNGTRLWASPSDLGKSKEVKTTNTKLSDLGFEQIRVLDKRSILITCIGSTIGKMGIAYEEMSSNQQINAITCNETNNPDFYYYVLFKIKDKIQKLAGTQAVPLLNKTDFSQIKVIQPPLKEQAKIADILSTADEKIDATQGLIQKAETLKKGLLQKLLSEGIGHSEFKDSELGKIPESWDVVELRNIGKVSMCKRIMKNETTPEGVIPFYKIGTFGKEADAFITKEIYEEYKNKYSFPKQGDILISASGTIGRLVVYDGVPAYFQDSNIVWIDNQEEKLLNSLLFYLYKTVKWNTDGNTIARLYNENLRRIKIPLPPLEEQKEIASILSTADEKLKVLRAKKQKYETLKKGLLQKLLSGEVRV